MQHMINNDCPVSILRIICNCKTESCQQPLIYAHAKFPAQFIKALLLFLFYSL